MGNEQPMHCALCGKPYPWTLDFWESLTWAVCWRCNLKRERDERRSEVTQTKVHGTLAFFIGLAGGALFALLGGLGR